MHADTLTVFNIAIDALGLMICIGAVMIARRIGARVAKPAAVTSVSFGRDMAQEMLRQRIASAFANISSSLHNEQRALDSLFDPTGNPAAPVPTQSKTKTGRVVPAPAATTETTDAAIDRMVAQGMGMAAIAKALGVTPGEVELRLKLRRPSARS